MTETILPFNVWAANIGTLNQGQSLSLTNDDKLASTLPDADGTLTSTNGASVEFTNNGVVTFEAPDPWNTVKSFKIDGVKQALDGKALVVKGFVHADIDLFGGISVDSTIIVDGAKRGQISTDSGKDNITLGVATNGGENWRQTFEIGSGSGDDTVLIKAADDKGLWNNKTDGSTQIVFGYLESGDDSYDSSSIAISDRIYAGSGNDTIKTGAGDDRIHGNSGNDSIEAGDGKDVIIGGTGNDTINGGKGYDQITTGTGLDVLEYTDADFGFDVIFDFTSVADRVDLSGIGITEAQLDTNDDDIIDASDDLVAVQGTAINIDFGGGNVIQFKATSALDVADFIFA